MYTYPNITQQISKKTTTTTKTYDEEGRLITEETYEEIEYVSAPVQTPLVPNTPWIISNAANTHYFDFDHPLGQALDAAELFNKGDVRKSDIDGGYSGI